MTISFCFFTIYKEYPAKNLARECYEIFKTFSTVFKKTPKYVVKNFKNLLWKTFRQKLEQFQNSFNQKNFPYRPWIPQDFFSKITQFIIAALKFFHKSTINCSISPRTVANFLWKILQAFNFPWIIKRFKIVTVFFFSNMRNWSRKIELKRKTFN